MKFIIKALVKYMYFACDMASLLIQNVNNSIQPYLQFFAVVCDCGIPWTFVLTFLTFVQSCQCLAYHPKVLLWFAIYLKSGKSCLTKVRGKN